ncbi:hypothetical protein [Sphingobacterium litopenaei]|uniref:Tetratricopeptide repeat protein n=2 Tax=Sphingobacterium TaxID=28453 RepID=A0ABR7YFZ8_9SPHI|nr:hypothetical protein [Sphingobacterium litopenaei]MBD1430240.1 hypothetical protein [Sphingobacterium litopenaei]
MFNARIKSLLGLTEAYRGEYEKANQLLNEGYQIATSVPDTSEILYNQFMQARVLVLRKQFAAAIEKYKTVIANNNKDFAHYRY